MINIDVNASTAYSIKIEGGCLNGCGTLARNITPAKSALIVTDSNVAPLYLSSVRESLASAGVKTADFIFKAGEESKTLATVSGIYEALCSSRITRSDIIIALGGGVTGDMAGFAAATYQRGIGFIQIPTTLLAQVDSSVGGKTGVDLPEGKNLIGAFWQPLLVLIDPDTLKTLPERFISDGMAEVIKYGCIKSTALFKRCENGDAPDADMIFECVKIKRDIVEADEREKGPRMLLNFGHTIGHAIEKTAGYGAITHGEAVGIGMLLIAASGEMLGITLPGTADRIKHILLKYSLPVSTDILPGEICNAALNDKKASGDSISLALISEIGRGFIKKINKKELFSYIAYEQNKNQPR